MPVYEPTASQFNLNGSVTLRARANTNVFAAVNFTTSQTVSALSIPASVAFNYKYDTVGNVAFYGNGTPLNLPGNVSFYAGSNTVSASGFVTFTYNIELPASVSFYQPDEVNLVASVLFTTTFATSATVNFRQYGNLSIPANVFLGFIPFSFHANVTFVRSSYTDFNGNIQIQQVTTQKSPNFSNVNDFPAIMQILGLANKTLPASVSFKRPPIDIDTLANVSFTQFNSKDFYCNMTIQNGNLGLGNIPINMQTAPASHDAASTASTATPLENPPEINNIQANTDATGYFEINNLSPGYYYIVPTYPGLNFTPGGYTVQIIASNITLYFTADGKVLEQVQANTILPPPPQGSICVLSNVHGTSGFSIDGYVLPANNEFTNLFSIIEDESTASGFRQTLSLDD